ncbi:gas vesicle protein GvpJ [Streptomyces sp. NPDC059853]|uniref:gas vesicle protein GvpJ n=1 Tax=Streptomyces sp. NPDC059853 TaxID=3346973 RepID=UPI00365DA3E1
MSTTTTTYRDDVACVPRTGTLYDVIDIILDRGMVIDVFLRVSLVGIEIVKVDIRIVIASVDTYLRFAEACNRMDLEADTRSRTVPELFGDMSGGGVGMVGKAGKKGAKHAAKAGEKKAKGVAGKAKKAAGGAKDKVKSALPGRLGEIGD